MEVEPPVLPQKIKRSLEGLHVICLRWWKMKFIHGMFKGLEDKYGVLEMTQEGTTLGGSWTTGRRIESSRGVKVKVTKLEMDLIALRETLPRVQAASL